MAKTADEAFDELATAAEEAVAELEQLEVKAWFPDQARQGIQAPWAAAAASAEQAIGELEAAAQDRLFPARILPLGTDLLADFDHYVRPVIRHGTAELAHVHGLALQEHPDLAALIRTKSTLELLRAEAASRVQPRGRDLTVEVVSSFARTVAEQLLAKGECEQLAAVLGEVVPPLRARVAAAVHRCEKEAPARAREQLAEWFRRKRSVRLDGRLLTGEEVAMQIEAGDAQMVELARHKYMHAPDGDNVALRNGSGGASYPA